MAAVNDLFGFAESLRAWMWPFNKKVVAQHDSGRESAPSDPRPPVLVHTKTDGAENGVSGNNTPSNSIFDSSFHPVITEISWVLRDSASLTSEDSTLSDYRLSTPAATLTQDSTITQLPATNDIRSCAGSVPFDFMSSLEPLPVDNPTEELGSQIGEHIVGILQDNDPLINPFASPPDHSPNAHVEDMADDPNMAEVPEDSGHSFEGSFASFPDPPAEMHAGAMEEDSKDISHIIEGQTDKKLNNSSIASPADSPVEVGVKDVVFGNNKLSRNNEGNARLWALLANIREQSRAIPRTELEEKHNLLDGVIHTIWAEGRRFIAFDQEGRNAFAVKNYKYIRGKLMSRLKNPLKQKTTVKPIHSLKGVVDKDGKPLEQTYIRVFNDNDAVIGRRTSLHPGTVLLTKDLNARKGEFYSKGIAQSDKDHLIMQVIQRVYARSGRILHRPKGSAEYVEVTGLAAFRLVRRKMVQCGRTLVKKRVN
ncbi:hypothetical protein ACHAWF_018442 [Thalassiosira exigua]